MKGTPMQRRHLLLAGLGVLATGLVGCSSTPDPSSTPSARTQTTIGLTYIPNVQFAPFYVAVDQGLFTANGVDVTLRHHGASEGLFTAIAANQEQFVIAGGDELVQAVSNGVDLVAVAAYFQAYP
ncbi:MAG TPA: ABC transporter substrate-binding protein, partial [Propionibacteriaceae bacterium]|nr:ABC transporter substrate-binding protein [Propionibacteriaceae bacterium]